MRQFSAFFVFSTYKQISQSKILRISSLKLCAINTIVASVLTNLFKIFIVAAWSMHQKQIALIFD